MKNGWIRTQSPNNEGPSVPETSMPRVALEHFIFVAKGSMKVLIGMKYNPIFFIKHFIDLC